MRPLSSSACTYSASFSRLATLQHLDLLVLIPKSPPGLVEVLTTGGIPPGILDPCSADRVYSALFTRVLTQNKKYYSRFPADVSLVQRIVTYLAGQPEGGLRLASGTLLTPRAFQLLGLSGLGSGGKQGFVICARSFPCENVAAAMAYPSVHDILRVV